MSYNILYKHKFMELCIIISSFPIQGIGKEDALILIEYWSTGETVLHMWNRRDTCQFTPNFSSREDAKGIRAMKHHITISRYR